MPPFLFAGGFHGASGFGRFGDVVGYGICAAIRDIVRDVMPFLFAMIAALAVITFVPGVVLFLPRLLGYGG
jgi:hypothetical protein